MKICDSLKCRLLKILPRVLSVEKKNKLFLTEIDYFALHSDIPLLLFNIFCVLSFFFFFFFNPVKNYYSI